MTTGHKGPSETLMTAGHLHRRCSIEPLVIGVSDQPCASVQLRQDGRSMFEATHDQQTILTTALRVDQIGPRPMHFCACILQRSMTLDGNW